MRNRIYLCLAHMSGNEMQYIKEAFDTNWVVPLGPNVNGFEKDLIPLPHLFLVPSSMLFRFTGILQVIRIWLLVLET